MNSDSTEDHLERISTLIEEKGYARVADLSAQLGLSTSTVSNMIRRLAERKFLNYEKYRGFSLTAEGKAVAARIKARHETLTALFTQLGLDQKTVEQEVEDIEHHIKPQTLEVLSRLVKYWGNNPKELQRVVKFCKTD